MSAKHFNAIAAEITKLPNKDHRLNAAVAVAAACKKLNPRFDAQRFFTACGV